VLAYSTVSQLGFMFLGVGVGSFTGGFFHVLTHAFFKALMFLGAGSIIHALHHEQDMRNMGGLRKYMPLTFGTFLMGYLAIIGFPGFSGFFSKDEILWLTFITPLFADLPLGTVMPKVLWAMGTVTALMTAFYMSRLMFMTFAGAYRGGHGHDAHGHDAHGHAAHDGHGHDAHGHGGHDPHESPLVLTGPLLVLAILSVVGGALNLPHWAAEHGFLHHMLGPVFTAAESGPYAVRFPTDNPLEFPLMGLTLAGIAASVGAAWYLYVKEPGKPREIAEKIKALYEGSLNKWYVDELYEATILKPLVIGSRQVLWAVVDSLLIDGAVNGAASAAQGLGTLHGRTSGGRVQAYAVGIAIGAAILVLAAALGA
jgi:NADH-quinone oxidoreductase subunit L